MALAAGDMLDDALCSLRHCTVISAGLQLSPNMRHCTSDNVHGQGLSLMLELLDPGLAALPKEKHLLQCW